MLTLIMVVAARVPEPFYTTKEVVEFREMRLGASGGVLPLDQPRLRFVTAFLGDGGGSVVLARSLATPGLECLAIESDALSGQGIEEAARRAPRVPVNEVWDGPTEISLRRNCIDDGRVLSRLLRRCTRLKRLYLGTNPLGDGAASLVEVLSRLEVLDLSDCQLTDQACVALARGLRRREADLHLDISRNPDVTTRGLVALLTAGRSCLRTLDASGCDVSGELPLKHTVLRDLSLANTGLTPPTAARIVQALAKSDAIQELDLSANTLTPRASRDKHKRRWFGGDAYDPHVDSTCALCALAAALRKPGAAPNLAVLKLQDVGARPPHAKLLEDARIKRPTPLHIDLRANPYLQAYL